MNDVCVYMRDECMHQVSIIYSFPMHHVGFMCPCTRVMCGGGMRRVRDRCMRKRPSRAVGCACIHRACTRLRAYRKRLMRMTCVHVRSAEACASRGAVVTAGARPHARPLALVRRTWLGSDMYANASSARCVHRCTYYPRRAHAV
jgi:hypothetical protein